MTSELAFPPGLIMVLGAILIPFLKGRSRLLLLLGLPVLTLAGADFPGRPYLLFLTFVVQEVGAE